MKDKARLSHCHRDEENQNTENLNVIQALGLDAGIEKEHYWEN